MQKCINTFQATIFVNFVTILLAKTSHTAKLRVRERVQRCVENWGHQCNYSNTVHSPVTTVQHLVFAVELLFVITGKTARNQRSPRPQYVCVCHYNGLLQSSESNDFNFIFSSQILFMFLSKNRWPTVTWNRAGKGILANIVFSLDGINTAKPTTQFNTAPFLFYFSSSSQSPLLFLTPLSLGCTHFNIFAISFIMYVAS